MFPLVLQLTLLGACATNGAGLGGKPEQVQAELAPTCPTPTQWTKAQENAVSKIIDRNATNQGMVLLVDEWDRLNSGAKICRGEP
jgi:hypothetical protein